jgi:hypothetical protein
MVLLFALKGIIVKTPRSINAQLVDTEIEPASQRKIVLVLAPMGFFALRVANHLRRRTALTAIHYTTAKVAQSMNVQTDTQCRKMEVNPQEPAANLVPKSLYAPAESASGNSGGRMHFVRVSAIRCTCVK